MRILDEVATDGERVHRIGSADLQQLFGITAPALSDLVKRGLVIRLGRDAYDLERSVNAYVTHLRGLAAGWGSGEQAASLTAERARLAKEQADAQAMKNAVQRGELVAADEVAREWGDVLRRVRARILAAPSRLRQELALAPDVAEAFDRELRDCLSGLGHDAD